MLLETVFSYSLPLLGASVAGERAIAQVAVQYVLNVVLVATYALYVVRREKIDVAAMVRSILRRG